MVGEPGPEPTILRPAARRGARLSRPQDLQGSRHPLREMTPAPNKPLLPTARVRARQS